jgi:hypothetical protein
MSYPSVHARETDFEFSGRKGHAVVVEFGKPWRFVFWSGAQYVGCVDLGKGVLFTPEWCETNSPNDNHCYEPIMDKKLRWSRIQILESGPARARVKWSYALADMRYRVFHGNTRAEEIYTIYPDGIAVREVSLWPGTENAHGGNPNFWQMQEWILINAAGTSPLDFLKTPSAFTMRDGNGGMLKIPWPLPPDWFTPLCTHFPQIGDWQNYIGKVELAGVPNPFAAFCKSQRLFPFVPCTSCGKNHPPMTLFPGKDLINIYQHWPVTEMEDFLEWVAAGDAIGRVATHTSFVDANYSMRWKDDDYVATPDPGTSWYILVGAVDESADGAELDRVVHSYRNPAAVEIVRGRGRQGDPRSGRLVYEGYDFPRRAYTFRQNDAEDAVRAVLRPGAAVLDPVVVVEGWHTPADRLSVRRDGRVLPPDAYRAQVSGHELVLWLAGSFDSKFTLELTDRGTHSRNVEGSVT